MNMYNAHLLSLSLSLPFSFQQNAELNNVIVTDYLDYLFTIITWWFLVCYIFQLVDLFGYIYIVFFFLFCFYVLAHSTSGDNVSRVRSTIVDVKGIWMGG